MEVETVKRPQVPLTTTAVKMDIFQYQDAFLLFC